MRCVRSLTVFALYLLAAACGSPPPAETLQLTGLAGERLEVGDRIEIDARNLPAPGDVRRIAVTLRGTMTTPGATPCPSPVEYTVVDPPADEGTRDPETGEFLAQSYSSRVGRTLRLEGAERLSFAVTDEMFAALAHCPDRATSLAPGGHVTLAFGDAGTHASPLGITVRIDGVAGVRAIGGTLRGRSLDLLAAPSARVAVEPALRRRADRTLAFLGLELAPPPLSNEGLVLSSVRTDSPAERAGLTVGDVLESMDGLSLLAPSDVVPGTTARFATFAVRHAGVHESRAVQLAGLVPEAPGELAGAAVMVALAWGAFLALSVRTPALVTALRRRARVRLRPGRDRGRAFVAWLAHSLAGHAPSRPSDPPPWITRALVGVPWFATASLAPFAPALVALDPDLSLVYAVLAAVRLARTLLLHAYDPSPVTFAGTGRAIVHYVPCGAPALAAVAGIVLADGTLHARGLVAAQGGDPWQWHLFRTPMGLALGLLFALGLVVSGGTHPLVPSPGDTTGTRRVIHLAALLEWTSAGGMALLGTVLFLGGWQLPGVSLAVQESSSVLQMLGVACCGAKTLALLVGLLAVRWAWPGVRIDHAVVASWRPVAMVTVLALVVLAAWLAVVPSLPLSVPVAVAQITFGACVLAALLAMARPWLVGRARPLAAA